MRALVVYESMFGNTRQIAEAVAEGLRTTYEVTVVPVAEARSGPVRVDLLVVGGPTHAWSLSRPATREGAATQAGKPGSRLQLEPSATGPGLREWLADLPTDPGEAAAFDTRIGRSRLITGRASARIARMLRRRGRHLVDRPESFLVTTADTTLLPGELHRARDWGAALASRSRAASRT